MLAEVGSVSRFTIFVHDGAGVPQTGLIFANMIMHVADNGTRVANPTAGGYAMAMTEIDAINAQGYYSIVITPQAVGHLSAIVTHATNDVEDRSASLEVHSISLSDLDIVATQAGANTVTITVDDGVDPLLGVGVDVFAADDTTPVLLGMTTDSSGQVVVALDAATYNVHLSKALVTFTVPEALVVPGAPLAQTYHGVVATPSAGTATTVVVTGTLLNVDGTTMEDTEVKAQVVSHPTIISTMGVGTPSATTYTDSDGYFELTLLRNATVNLVVPAIGLRQQVITPDLPTVEFSTLL
jgi:hypothetical protein